MGIPQIRELFWFNHRLTGADEAHNYESSEPFFKISHDTPRINQVGFLLTAGTLVKNGINISSVKPIIDIAKFARNHNIITNFHRLHLLPGK